MTFINKISLLCGLSLWFYPPFAFTEQLMVKKLNNKIEEEKDEVSYDYNQSRCIECHLNTEKELMSQVKSVRKRHRKAKVKHNSCSKCHDKEEIEEICCHAFLIIINN
jgi:hypothetical protein